jgi:hypothetical protein
MWRIFLSEFHDFVFQQIRLNVTSIVRVRPLIAFASTFPRESSRGVMQDDKGKEDLIHQNKENFSSVF